MDEITLKNYRCFRDEQRARLAPLTLLVGENSTGKTSFLAMIKALSDIAYRFQNPDFKREPYDLGSYDEIAHHRNDNGGSPDAFQSGFTVNAQGEMETPISFGFTFRKSGTTPVPVSRRISSGEMWFDETLGTNQSYNATFGNSRGTWGMQVPKQFANVFLGALNLRFPIHFFWFDEDFHDRSGGKFDFEPLAGSPSFSTKDRGIFEKLFASYLLLSLRETFAGAPVRSKPRRTYDSSQPTPDSEGDYVPMYLADLLSRDNQNWSGLKDRLERFGKESGLFDEISIRQLGERGSDPFQVQIRKSGNGFKGPHHNLIDVGYGVSQALPVITELLRPDAPSLFLLQQPEVHLHPSAQAALGSLFCQIAGPERQIIVETHSDYLLDRIRMEVRDAGDSGIRPKDVAVLFFERNALDVQIHSLRIDKEGNIADAPNSYRQFFMQETARSLGL